MFHSTESGPLKTQKAKLHHNPSRLMTHRRVNQGRSQEQSLSTYADPNGVASTVFFCFFRLWVLDLRCVFRKSPELETLPYGTQTMSSAQGSAGTWIFCFFSQFFQPLYF